MRQRRRYTLHNMILFFVITEGIENVTDHEVRPGKGPRPLQQIAQSVRMRHAKLRSSGEDDRLHIRMVQSLRHLHGPAYMLAVEGSILENKRYKRMIFS
jgi:hypothetical protein